MQKELTALELTEEIKCFAELRSNLITRRKKAEAKKDNARTCILSRHITILDRHLLLCFQEREEQYP